MACPVSIKLSRQEAEANLWLSRFAQTIKDGRPASHGDRIEVFRRFVEAGNLASTEPLLPVLLNLKGRPYDLSDHFPFSPLFRTTLPRKTVLMCARQVSKSTSQASCGILFSNSVPHTTTLFITPLFEQIRRFSSNYVGEFIDQSPVKQLWSDTTTNNSVLQRSFRNASKQIFSFALLNVDRTRGVTSDVCKFDECQDLMREHIPIIQETMSFSDWAISVYAGTPKSLDNTMEGFWQRSSQAQWIVPCYACGRENIPSNEYDLQEMIGPYSPDISEARPGTICAKCGRPINPRFGRWLHKYPDRRWEFAGYHVPQILMPLHYAKPAKWSELLAKREYLPANVFHNEVLGESYDSGSKLVTLTELKAAATLPWNNRPNDPDGEMLARLEHYPMRVLGVDWGGGGKEGVSFTTLALLGWKSGGEIDVLWGKRLTTPHDHIREAKEIREWISRFRPHFIAHDYTGAGTLRETFLVQTGRIPADRIVPIAYVRSASHNIINFVAASPVHPRKHYQADKTRSLLYTTNVLKLGQLRTFRYDYRSDDEPGLLHDFLALVDEKVETASSAGIYVIKRQEGFSDDFAHAVNLGCLSLWSINDAWPDFAALTGFAAVTRAQLTAAIGEPDDDTEPLMGGYFGG